ncbi:hypothetical protein AYI69_g8358 [Smittium culicis]|uniref:Uncharacterized protein n=1 Tax=Smittium culicis TaxID=133412 RepID=A0A1R1XK09_9FUNG|nr:hypothetical protein AYI69_g8358 [Smittium culicis]
MNNANISQEMLQEILTRLTVLEESSAQPETTSIPESVDMDPSSVLHHRKTIACRHGALQRATRSSSKRHGRLLQVPSIRHQSEEVFCSRPQELRHGL